MHIPLDEDFRDEDLKKEDSQKHLIRKIVITIFIIVIIGYVGFLIKNRNTSPISEQQAEEQIKKQVSTLEFGTYTTNNNLHTVGIVTPANTVQVVTQTKGTLQNIYVNQGDFVYQNELLASLFDTTSFTNLNNAQIAYFNMQNSLFTTKNLADQSINQAKLGLENSENKIETAKIALDSLQETFKNTQILHKQTISDTKTNAINTFDANLTTIASILDQTNYLIHAEGANKLVNIDQNLSVTNPQSLIDATDTYFKVKKLYTNLQAWTLDEDTILLALHDLNFTLSKTASLVNYVNDVLENTVPYYAFNETALNTQRNIYFSLKNSVVAAQTNTQKFITSLETLPITHEQENKNLQTQIATAKKQYELAKLSDSNAKLNLESAKESKNAQLSSAQSALDSAKGQLDLINTQIDHLSIYSPVSGTVVNKNIDIGATLNPGQALFTIADTSQVIIKVALTSEQIYNIQVGDEVLINNTYQAIVEKIAPSADPTTRKVTVDIFYDNRNQDLILETFVDIDFIFETKTTDTSNYLPLNAVTLSQNENYVFIAKDGKAIKQLVTTGEVKDKAVQITNGLQLGDVVIMENNKLLEDQDEITIIN